MRLDACACRCRDAQSWLNLQVAYELRSAEIASGREVKRVVRPRAA